MNYFRLQDIKLAEAKLNNSLQETIKEKFIKNDLRKYVSYLQPFNLTYCLYYIHANRE